MNEISAIAVRRHADAEEVELRVALRRFVEGRLRDRNDGEDIVQETYVRLYSYRRTRPVADVGAFCFAVARNLVSDHFRRRLIQPPAAELAEDIVCPRPRAEEILDYRQRVDILVRALRVMPPLRREVFLRRRLDGIPSAVIAADLELSAAAVDKHCSRALADLRVALERRGLPAGAGR
jgi:RNA polymerase sigma-70 factor (ECF subfamily)